MRWFGADLTNEHGQVVDVLVKRVGRIRLDAVVGPGVALAVGDRTVGGPDCRKLLSPHTKVSGPAVDEEYRGAFAMLAVGKRRPIDLGYLGEFEHGFRHRSGFLLVARLAPCHAVQRIGDNRR